VYDVIKRIKAGSFKGADYVLFGTCPTSTSPGHERAGAHRQLFGGAGSDAGGGFQPDQHQTYEITSAFTAMGEAQDTKLVNGRDIKMS
jgi:hypothetical protein